MCKYLLAILLNLIAFCDAKVQAADDCLPEVRAQLVSDAPPQSFDLRCNLKLEPSDSLLTQINFTGPDASGLTLDCGGATLDGGSRRPNAGRDMIQIRSVLKGGNWLRPQDVTVRNCQIIGSMRIMGMGSNGEAKAVHDSSRLDSNHVQRVRTAAPTRITLDNLTITATKRTPLYLSPGVTHVTLTNSELKGNAIRTAIYLDAESGFNTIKGNSIHVKIFDEYLGKFNRLGPQMSVDTSSFNKIISNHFSALEGGGIFLFRNCGLKGTIRHGKPSNNQIINNDFFYKKYKGGNPAIFLGAHGGGWRHFPFFGTCSDDVGKPWGSSASDADHAENNIVIQNQIIKLSAAKMIREGFDTTQFDSQSHRLVQVNLFNNPNLIAFNDEKLATAIERSAGCYLDSGYKELLLSGESTDVFRIGKGKPVCSPIRAVCSDGDLKLQKASDCQIFRVHFGCSVTGNNAGCSKAARCPAAARIVAARAACNLESGEVAPEQLFASDINVVTVVRSSDKTSDGTCRLASTAVAAGTKPLEGALDRGLIGFSCKEHDANGGDCHIAGELFCR